LPRKNAKGAKENPTRHDESAVIILYQTVSHFFGSSGISGKSWGKEE
jgi:hypothetical protein